MIIIRSSSITTTTGTTTTTTKFIKANVDNHFIDLSTFIIIPRNVSTTTTTAIINIIAPAMRSKRKDTYSIVYSFKPLLNLKRYLCYSLDYHPLPPS